MTYPHTKVVKQLDERLLTLDPRAITHVLSNSKDYEKPWQSRRLISSLIGNGECSCFVEMLFC